jgi:hypothetical protein
MNSDIKYHVIQLILKVSLLPEKNQEKMQIIERA